MDIKNPAHFIGADEDPPDEPNEDPPDEPKEDPPDEQPPDDDELAETDEQPTDDELSSEQGPWLTEGPAAAGTGRGSGPAAPPLVTIEQEREIIKQCKARLAAEPRRYW